LRIYINNDIQTEIYVVILLRREIETLIEGRTKEKLYRSWKMGKFINLSELRNVSRGFEITLVFYMMLHGWRNTFS
jgi:hypothetical protein